MSRQTVLDWNETLLDAIRFENTNPPEAAKAMAMAQIAVFDALNAINGSPYDGYALDDFSSNYASASADAAIATASYQVLKDLFPTFSAELDARYQASMNTANQQPGAELGVALGNASADSIQAMRVNDGSGNVGVYPGGDAIGQWRPTPPGYQDGLLPQWPGVDTWAIASSDQYRPDGPPATTTDEYATSFNFIKQYGGINSTLRTPDQTELANFWVDGPGTATPPGHWHQIGQELAVSEGLSTLETARMFALLGVANADAGIVAWDGKYTYGDWRPVTAIPLADQDGNPATSPEADWLPLITTPPFPDYISGHSTFSASAASVMEAFFGRGDFHFTTPTDAMPGVTREFSSLWEAAVEAGISRVYGGIHWLYSNDDALTAGRSLGQHVYESTMLTQRFLSDASELLVVDHASARAVHAMAGNDQLFGSTLVDRLYGGADGDMLRGNGGNDHLYGGTNQFDRTDGNDTLYGGTSSDWLYGNAGDDVLYGGNGEFDPTDSFDFLYGGAGNDTLYGNGGNDKLSGGIGSNTLYGGAGDDTFLLAANNATDRIVNFEGAGSTGGDTLLVWQSINGGTYNNAAQVLEAKTTIGADALFNFANGYSVTVEGGAGINAGDIALTNALFF